ncbi:hypothetical protein GCM10010912_30830 [Paenibacillus albidus]|uniref:Uncharacterized protein n=1 Tax=Paenibacillus albidus TaxID=2041023 RepID=A0A917CD37_9BACL|nr:hypothetical protein GCM10010912_30830 [Paenibacillus albidus]
MKVWTGNAGTTSEYALPALTVLRTAGDPKSGGGMNDEPE